MRYYATLFDSKYLPQGLVLYDSLKKHSREPFTLYVLALDRKCLDELVRLKLPHVTIVWLDYFLEDYRHGESLRQAKRTRSWKEFCWTCASVFTSSLIARYDRTAITYLDADLMFFSDPKVIFDEIGDRSIAVIPHRLIPSKRHLEVNGKFNVSWVTFRGDIGRACADRWAEQCLDRCSEHVGCGDQKYLDEWPELYKEELCVIQNIGAGLAPWNLANYSPIPKVVFMHYHEYLHGKRLTNYELRPEDIELIYKPYIAAVEAYA